MYITKHWECNMVHYKIIKKYSFRVNVFFIFVVPVKLNSKLQLKPFAPKWIQWCMRLCLFSIYFSFFMHISFMFSVGFFGDFIIASRSRLCHFYSFCSFGVLYRALWKQTAFVKPLWHAYWVRELFRSSVGLTPSPLLTSRASQSLIYRKWGWQDSASGTCLRKSVWENMQLKRR